jgi:hyperosmotically inducible periplasmic protein
MVIEFARPVLRVAAMLAATLVMLACSAVPSSRSSPPRSPEEQAADEAITTRVKAALRSSPDIYTEHIDVDTDRNVVHLSGWVYSDKASRAATAISATVPGVRWVDNELDIVEVGGAQR